MVGGSEIIFLLNVWEPFFFLMKLYKEILAGLKIKYMCAQNSLHFFYIIETIKNKKLKTLDAC